MRTRAAHQKQENDSERIKPFHDGAFRLATVTLRPHIPLETGADACEAQALVEKAPLQWFIGTSVSAKVDIEPVIQFAEQGVAS